MCSGHPGLILTPCTDLVVEKASDHAEILSKFEEHFRRLASKRTSSQVEDIRVKFEEARRH
jgi:hypothetical protein